MTTHSLAEVLTQLMTGIQEILYEVATAIADNASVIATVAIVGGLAYITMRYGSRIFKGATGFLRGLF